MSKKEYVSMRGKVVDIELLKKMNELTPAIGNVKVNARGDELGPGGKIVRKREDIIKEYYKGEPTEIAKGKKSVQQEKTVADPVVTNTPAPAPQIKLEEISETEKELIDDDWEEDSTGNFVKKEKSNKKPKAE